MKEKFRPGIVRAPEKDGEKQSGGNGAVAWFILHGGYLDRIHKIDRIKTRTCFKRWGKRPREPSFTSCNSAREDARPTKLH